MEATSTDTVFAPTELWRESMAFRNEASRRAPGRLGPIIERRVRELIGASTDGVAPLPDDLTDAETLVVDLAEQFVIDVHGISDARFARLGDYYDEPEQVAIMFQLGLVDGFAKLELVGGSVPSDATDRGGQSR